MAISINGTTGISGVDGSAGTPAVQGTDSNTGLVFPAADTLAASTGGSERMRIDSSGNVGIGTSSPSYKLDVRSSLAVLDGSSNIGFWANGSTYTQVWQTLQSVNDFVIQTAASKYISFGINSAEKMRLDTSGNVGIGTSSPAVKLDVAGDARSNAWIGGANGSAPTADAAVYRAADFTLAFSTGSTERARIDSSGNLLVGTTSSTVNPGISLLPSGRINIGRSNDDAVAEFYRSGTRVGQINVTTTNTLYITSSDYRLKENIAPMTGALSKVTSLKPCTYTWKESGEAAQGFIAHELQEIVPDAVVGEKDAVDADGNPVYQGIDTSFLVATLTAAIQELKAENDALKARLDAANL